MSGESQEKERNILVLENQECPMCFKKSAVLSEYEVSDPFVGEIVIFALKCNNCGYKNSDLEFLNPKEPAEYSINIESKEDLNIRVIKSGQCEIKIPNFRISVESTLNGESFISNIEGVLLRFKKQIQFLKSSSDEAKIRKKAKNLIKNIDKVFNGEKKITVKLIDKSGNSAIVSDKVKIKKF